MTDNVNHPSHYNSGSIEVIEMIEDQELGYHLGCAVKYIMRAGKKEPDNAAKYVEDLEKAIWYVRRRLEICKAEPRRPNDMNEEVEEAIGHQRRPVSKTRKVLLKTTWADQETCAHYWIAEPESEESFCRDCGILRRQNECEHTWIPLPSVGGKLCSVCDLEVES